MLPSAFALDSRLTLVVCYPDLVEAMAATPLTSADLDVGSSFSVSACGFVLASGHDLGTPAGEGSLFAGHSGCVPCTVNSCPPHTCCFTPEYNSGADGRQCRAADSFAGSRGLI